MPMPALSKLLRLAQAHGSTVLCLDGKGAGAPSLGSVVGLRVQAERVREKGGRFLCRAVAVKDKRQGAGRRFELEMRGVAGLTAAGPLASDASGTDGCRPWTAASPAS